MGLGDGLKPWFLWIHKGARPSHSWIVWASQDLDPWIYIHKCLFPQQWQLKEPWPHCAPLYPSILPSGAKASVWIPHHVPGGKCSWVKNNQIFSASSSLFLPLYCPQNKCLWDWVVNWIVFLPYFKNTYALLFNTGHTNSPSVHNKVM